MMSYIHFYLTWTSFSWLSTFWRILADMQKACNFARAQKTCIFDNFSQRTVQTHNDWLHCASCILQRGRGFHIQTRKGGTFLSNSHPKYTNVTIMNSLFSQKEIGWTPSAHTQTKICSRDHRTHYFLHVWAVDRAEHWHRQTSYMVYKNNNMITKLPHQNKMVFILASNLT